MITSSDSILKIAIPVAEGRLHGHFGGCAQFALVETHRKEKTVVSIITVAAPPHTPGSFPRWLKAQGVSVVIVGGIGQRAIQIFAEEGIQVLSGQANMRVEELVACYLDGALAAASEGCSNHEHHHGHHQCHGADRHHQ